MTETTPQPNGILGIIAAAIITVAFFAWWPHNDKNDKQPTDTETAVERLLALPSWTIIASPHPFTIVQMHDSSSLNQADYRRAYQDQCARRNICHVLFWPADAQPPKALPISDAQLQTQAAKIAHNRNTGWQQELWNCDMFKSASNCLNRPPAQ